MSSRDTYPRRLIEVDLPIREISENARYENSLRHGRISNLHLWWARRPTVVCRGVTLAALWPDPADPLCPAPFRVAAATAMMTLRGQRGGKNRNWNEPLEVRSALLDFIAEFTKWGASTDQGLLETARRLVQIAHESLGGTPGTRPLVVDPFAGGGSIPLEALRLGADTFASDSNQVAVLLNKVALEYLPKYRNRLAEEVRRWGEWVKKEAEKELAEFYPNDGDGSKPITYLWARTIRCEGPGCGAEVPLLRSLGLAKKSSRTVALRIVANAKSKLIRFEIIGDAKGHEVQSATVKSGSVTCPIPGCGFTTPLKAVREQLKQRRGGTADALLLCVVTVKSGRDGRSYRLPTDRDSKALRKALQSLTQQAAVHSSALSLVPNEEISRNELRRIAPPLYGMMTWGDLFSSRQALALSTLARLIRNANVLCAKTMEQGLADAVTATLALSLSRLTDLSNALTRWKQDAECPVQLISRQAIQFVWDFAETAVLSESSGSWTSMVERTAHVLDAFAYAAPGTATIQLAPAQSHPLPNDSADAFVTDPPYYDSVPYAHLSDFFYVWLRRSIPPSLMSLFNEGTVDKEHEIVVDRKHRLSTSIEGRRFLRSQPTPSF